MRITRALALLAVLAAVFTLACSQQKANTPDVNNQIQDSLKMQPSLNHVFTIRWEVA